MQQMLKDYPVLIVMFTILSIVTGSIGNIPFNGNNSKDTITKFSSIDHDRLILLEGKFETLEDKDKIKGIAIENNAFMLKKLIKGPFRG